MDLMKISCSQGKGIKAMELYKISRLGQEWLTSPETGNRITGCDQVNPCHMAWSGKGKHDDAALRDTPVTRA